MGIEKVLHYCGVGLIILGLLGGLIAYFSIDKESYDTAKEIYDELYDNEFAEAEYITAKTIYVNQLSSVIVTTLITSIGGLLIMGISSLISNQNQMIRLLKETKRSSVV